MRQMSPRLLSPAPASRLIPYAVHLDRAGDVLDCLCAEIFETETQLVQHLVADRTAYADPTRVRQRL